MEHALMPLEPRCDSGDELLSPGRRVHNLIGHPEGIGWIRVPVTENTDRVPGHRGRGRGCLTPAAYIANHHSPAPRAWVDVVEVAAHAEILGRRHVGGGDVDTRNMRPTFIATATCCAISSTNWRSAVVNGPTSGRRARVKVP